MEIHCLDPDQAPPMPQTLQVLCILLCEDFYHDSKFLKQNNKSVASLDCSLNNKRFVEH